MKKNVRVLLLFAFVLAGFAFDYYYITPGSEALRASIEKEYNALKKDEQFIKGAGSTEEDIKAMIREVKDFEGRLVQEKNDFLAGVKIQEKITEMSDRAGLKIATIKPLVTEKKGSYLAIPVYFEGTGTIKQISEFLKNIESGGAIFSIDRLNLNISNIQNPKELKFKIQISGLSRS